MPGIIVCHLEVREFLIGWLEGVFENIGGFLLVIIVRNRVLVNDFLLRGIASSSDSRSLSANSGSW